MMEKSKPDRPEDCYCVGEPLCGWGWIIEHEHDLDAWMPTFEFSSPGNHVIVYIKYPKQVTQTVKMMREIMLKYLE